QTYSRRLLSAGHGYPLIPIMMMRGGFPKEYLSRGICIGDVGWLNGASGFTLLFSIFLPADHPIN
ncbi:hypothetical protein CPC08DRAFT_600621, partial [Agrocybe pediades]